MSVSDPQYWDSRYELRDRFEREDSVDDRGMGWYCEYVGPLRDTFRAVAGDRRDLRVLNVGCGVDRLAADLYFDGYTNILSTDISKTAIDELAATSAMAMPDAEWQIDDAMHMKVQSETVDVVLDKGTLDSVMLASGTWVSNAVRMIREVHRVLKVGGTYILLTHGRQDPKGTRYPLLSLPNLAFKLQVSPDLGGYFMFVCSKLQNLPEAEEQARWAEVLKWAQSQDAGDNTVEAESMMKAADAKARPPPAAPTAPAAAPQVSAEDQQAALEAEWDRIDEEGQ